MPFIFVHDFFFFGNKCMCTFLSFLALHFDQYAIKPTLKKPFSPFSLSGFSVPVNDPDPGVLRVKADLDRWRRDSGPQSRAKVAAISPMAGWLSRRVPAALWSSEELVDAGRSFLRLFQREDRVGRRKRRLGPGPPGPASGNVQVLLPNGSTSACPNTSGSPREAPPHPEALTGSPAHAAPGSRYRKSRLPGGFCAGAAAISRRDRPAVGVFCRGGAALSAGGSGPRR